jgi:hypothetical protein
MILPLCSTGVMGLEVQKARRNSGTNSTDAFVAVASRAFDSQPEFNVSCEIEI